ncbi:MAG: hypothetical protein WCD76_18960, partial [Pyrinomonadaceae bacterium]
MKTRRKMFAAALTLALLPAVVAPTRTDATPLASASTQGQGRSLGALERGYRTGYSDGYQSGWGDSIKKTSAGGYKDKADYQRADRAYIEAYGALEDYRDGYQQGFEIGYEAGYEHQGFDSNLPVGGVTRRGATVAGNGESRGGRSDVANDDDSSGSSSGASSAANNSVSTSGAPTSNARIVPSNTIMKVELLNRLSTDVSQNGDRFEARVIEPQEYADAVVAGRITNLQRPGKTRGRAQLQLTFEQIKLAGGDWTDFSAQVTEVLDRDGSNVGDVDPEGGVRGKDSTKDDVAK